MTKLKRPPFWRDLIWVLLIAWMLFSALGCGWAVRHDSLVLRSGRLIRSERTDFKTWEITPHANAQDGPEHQQ